MNRQFARSLMLPGIRLVRVIAITTEAEALLDEPGKHLNCLFSFRFMDEQSEKLPSDTIK